MDILRGLMRGLSGQSRSPVTAVDLVDLLTAIAPYKKRVASACGIIGQGHEGRIPIAAKAGQGLSIFDFASTPSKNYSLDADDVRRLAKSGLSSFCDSVSKELAPIERPFLEVMRNSNQESVRSLLTIIADESKFDLEFRNMALDYLAGVLALDVIDELITNLREGNEYIRFYVVKTLAEMYHRHLTSTIKSHDIVGLIIAAMQDPDDDIRWLTAVIFRRIKNARAIEPLRNLSLTDPNSRVRQYAEAALTNQDG
jgi:hypothetical protein